MYLQDILQKLDTMMCAFQELLQITVGQNSGHTPQLLVTLAHLLPPSPSATCEGTNPLTWSKIQP